jgi:hypothetical protein
MDYITMDVYITLLTVHVIALAIAIYLWRDAPCWMQKVCMLLLALSFVACCAAFVGALSHVRGWRGFLLLAAALEHLAVLLYVFRIWWQGEQKKWTYLTNSRK